MTRDLTTVFVLMHSDAEINVYARSETQTRFANG